MPRLPLAALPDAMLADDLDVSNHRLGVLGEHKSGLKRVKSLTIQG